jgi:hypothetical protein
LNVRIGNGLKNNPMPIVQDFTEQVFAAICAPEFEFHRCFTFQSIPAIQSRNLFMARYDNGWRQPRPPPDLLESYFSVQTSVPSLMSL